MILDVTYVTMSIVWIVLRIHVPLNANSVIKHFIPYFASSVRTLLKSTKKILEVKLGLLKNVIVEQ